MYKIMKKILLCLILVSIFYFNLRNVSINTKSNSVIEKVYCNATLEQDFSDNEILIVLNKETSRQLDLNMAFESIDYDELEDLTSSYDTVDEMNDNFRRILLDLNLDMAIVYSLNDNRKYSINGSYILPSGIVILVDEDIKAYFNNKLIFYNKNNIT